MSTCPNNPCQSPFSDYLSTGSPGSYGILGQCAAGIQQCWECWDPLALPPSPTTWIDCCAGNTEVEPIIPCPDHYSAPPLRPSSGSGPLLALGIVGVLGGVGFYEWRRHGIIRESRR